MKAKIKIGILVAGVAVLAIVAIKLMTEKKSPSEQLEDQLTVSEAKSEEMFDKRREDFISNKIGQGTDDDQKKKLLRKVADNSVIESDFNALNSMLDAQIANIEKLELPVDKKSQIVSAFKKIFDTGAIYDAYLTEIYKNFSVEELQELDTVYSNELVKKSLHEMHVINSPEGQKEFAEYLKNLPSRGLSDTRKAQLSEFDHITGLSTNSAKLVNDVMALVQQASSGQKVSPEDKAQMEEYMATKIKEGVMFSLAKAHDGISDSEMKTLIELRSKASALKEVKTRAEVISLALTSAKAKQGFERIMESAK